MIPGLLNIPAASNSVRLSSTAHYSTGSNGTIIMTKPSNTLPNDILVAGIEGAFSGGSNWTAPAGWNEVYDRSGNGGLGVFWRLNDASSSYTFTNTNSNNYGGFIAAFSNAVYDRIGTADIDGTTDVVLQSISEVVSGSMLVAFCAKNNGSNTFTTPSGMTLIGSNNAAQVSVYMFIESIPTTVSVTGSRTSISSTTNNTTGIMLSLKPN